MFPLMLQSRRAPAEARGPSRVAASRRSPLRQSHGGTNSPVQIPRFARLAAASWSTYAVE